MAQFSESTISALLKTVKIGLISIVALTTGAVAASVNNPSPASPAVQASKTTRMCNLSTSTSTETQVIPFQTTTINDSTRPKGTTTTQTAGVDGTRTLTYQETKYSPTGCSSDTKVLTNERVTTQPTSQVNVVGTYVAPIITCSNGSYTNVDGIVVCNPSSSPTGATAKCFDGTYSYSLNHSGTCSHHGGVAAWL